MQREAGAGFWVAGLLNAKPEANKRLTVAILFVFIQTKTIKYNIIHEKTIND